MAPHGLPFDFDLNELPPPENDGVNGISTGPVPEPLVQQDPLPPALVPEPKAQQDPLPPPAPVPELTTAHVPPPARSLAQAPEASPVDSLPVRSPAPAPEASPVDPLPAWPLAPEASPDEPLPAPVRAPAPAPVPSPHHHLPSPVFDLEASLSSFDDEEEDEAELPPPPPLPLPPPPPYPPASWNRVDTSDSDDTAPQYSSPETWAPRGSRAATASDTTSPHKSRRRPDSCDDAISKRRRVAAYDEDGGSSRPRSGTGSRRRSGFGSPRRYERSGSPPPRHFYEQQDGGRHAPAAASKNRRRRRRGGGAQMPQHGFQYEGPVQKQQGRGWGRQQGFWGQERPQMHHGPHHGPVGYASYHPPSPPVVRREREQERVTGWDRLPNQAQEPPKIGGYQHREREAPSFRPPSTGGWDSWDDGSYGGGGRRIPPEEKPITGGAHHHQQAKAPPRGRDEHLPDRAYHPYARRVRVSGFDIGPDDDGGGRNPGRRT